MPSDRKRKVSDQQPTGRRNTPAQPVSTSRTATQQTISKLFSNSQQKPASRSSVSLSPSSKRQRQNPPALEAELPSSPPEQLPISKMYSFPAKSPSQSKVIDLTSGNGPKTPPRKTILRNGQATGFNPHGGPKKIIVKNFKIQNRTDPKAYFNTTWEKLSIALDRTFAGEKLVYSLEELYKGVENICRQGHGGELSGKLLKRCEEHMQRDFVAGLKSRTGEGDVEFLRAVLGVWKTWTTEMKTLDWIFCYMDRSYLLPQSKTLKDQCHTMFRRQIFKNPEFQSKIINGACELVAADRTSSMDDELFGSAVGMFHEIAVYTHDLEPKLLAASQTYVLEWVKQSSAQEVPEYLERALGLIAKETERCDKYKLDSSTRRDLMILLEDHLVAGQAERLVDDDAVADLLDQNDVEKLKQLFTFLQRRSLGEKIKPAFVKWLDDTGTTIVFDEKQQDSMVVRLMSFKQQLDNMLREAFDRNEELGHSLRKTFEKFINKTRKTAQTWGTDNSKPEEMIAKYLDLLLRGGAKAIPAQLSKAAPKPQEDEEENNEEDMDEETKISDQLDQVLDLFRFVHGKAVFEAFYKKDLARRLLMGRSASSDAERSMLTRLKTECGSGFTTNLEQMFTDIELAREELSSYKALLEERGDRPGVDLSVNILSASAWPTYPDIPVIIPMQIKAATDKYESHYKSKHSGRKLDWKHALAHCQLKAKFPKGAKELVVSSFQAIVLLLFNSRGMDEHLTYQFLKDETGLPESELNRTLQSLACARLRPLTKHPKGREINTTDTFTLNKTFDSPKYRLKINTVQLKETKEENQATHERVHQDRQFECQAAIVRILKGRKSIGVQELINEVITATMRRGRMGVGDIKKNLDRLIEKDYAERGENGEIVYIA